MVMNASNSTSWQAYRDLGKSQYERGEYEEALASFRSASSVQENSISAVDRQLLLSNVVACRLKLGGTAQARAAVHDAEACIALNPSWSKGHVRLASAYIALGETQHSNDACNALQTACQLDPNNRVARQMLVQELRRDHRTTTSTSSRTSSTSTSRSTEQQLDTDDDNRDPPENPNYISPNMSDRPNNRVPLNNNNNGNNNNNNNGNDNNLDVDDSVTLMDRIQFYLQRAQHWYLSQSDDSRMAMKVHVALLILYVAFGGRFGFGSSEPKLKGNYGAGNVYDQFHNQQQQQQQRQQQEQSYGNGGGGSSSYTTNTNTNTNYGGGGGYTSSDASGLLYILLTGVGIYVGHLFGISPWQIMMVMRMVGGRGRGGGMGGMGGMYGGGGRHRGGGGMRFGRGRW